MTYHNYSLEITPAVYLVFWGGQWNDTTTTDTSGAYTNSQARAYIQHFFDSSTGDGVGGSNWLGITTQYCQSYGGTACIRNSTSLVKGTWVDTTDRLPATVSDTDVGNEVSAAAPHFNYDTAAMYFVFTPHGVPWSNMSTTCAWHNSVVVPGPISNPTTVYGYVPYLPDDSPQSDYTNNISGPCYTNVVNSASNLSPSQLSFGNGWFDAFSAVAGHELAEAVTDPLQPFTSGGWYDATGSSTGEIGDKCDNSAAQGVKTYSHPYGNIKLGSDIFAVQSLWSNEITGCALSEWTIQSPSSPPGTQAQSMAFDAARQKVVLFGGWNPSASQQTWTWDGSNWSQMSPLHSPSARVGAAMAYDAATQTTVLFGGDDGLGNALGDTWSWNGSDWSSFSSLKSAPSKRTEAAMAYDSALGKIVLFGGFPSGNTAASDTWLWSGTAWSLQKGTAPPARGGARISFDAVHSQLVLFGGVDANSTDLNDTWLWSGSWSKATSLSQPPSPRQDFGMDYDGVLGTTVLFGGRYCVLGQPTCTGYAETWTWNGSSWTMLVPDGSPQIRFAMPIVYDSTRRDLVLFGGAPYNGSALSDTWVY